MMFDRNSCHFGDVQNAQEILKIEATKRFGSLLRGHDIVIER